MSFQFYFQSTARQVKSEMDQLVSHWPGQAGSEHMCGTSNGFLNYAGGSEISSCECQFTGSLLKST